jgi:NAD(P)-dependent dehydrogenase (short-subunit alcohol dehydrogenase family)
LKITILPRFKPWFFYHQAVARKMKENGGGSIVNVGSMWQNKLSKHPFFGLFMQKQAYILLHST